MGCAFEKKFALFRKFSVFYCIVVNDMIDNDRFLFYAVFDIVRILHARVIKIEIYI